MFPAPTFRADLPHVLDTAPLRRCDDCALHLGSVFHAIARCPLFGRPRAGLEVRCLSFVPIMGPPDPRPLAVRFPGAERAIERASSPSAARAAAICWCPRCDIGWSEHELLDGETCPHCLLVL